MTYHEPGVRPFSAITPEGFTMLDLLLAPSLEMHRIRSVCSDRFAALASHHFPVTAVVEASLEYSLPHARESKINWASMQAPEVRQCFVSHALEKMADDRFLEQAVLSGSANADSVDEKWQTIRDAMQDAASTHIPTLSPKKLGPWISETTLSLIEERAIARRRDNFPLEMHLRREVKRFAKRDRVSFLEQLAASADWQSLKKSRVGMKSRQT